MRINSEIYKGMFEDEQRFYQIKQDLLSNDATIVANRINEIKGEYGVFLPASISYPIIRLFALLFRYIHRR